jgi:flagellar hook protein FlgE
MFSGVSGLQAHQTKLDVIGNNIANVNTIGFKAGSVTFEDQLSQTLRASAGPGINTGGSNPAQVGLGVQLGAIDTLQTQGNLQTTGKNTDLAIQGNGFFMVGNGNNVNYTRDGSFDLDGSGQLVNPANGNKLLGYLADASGNIDTTQQITSDSTLKIPIGTLTSVKQSTSATFEGNLDASSALQSTTATLTGPLDVSQTPPTLNSTVYDSLGNAHTLQVQFQNPVAGPLAPGPGVPAGATQQWTLSVSLDGTAVSPSPTLYAVGGKFIFTDKGNPATGIGSKLQLNGVGSSGAPDFPLQVDFSGLSDQSNVTASANGQNSPSNIVSTEMTLAGNLNMDGGVQNINSTVYTAAGVAEALTTTLTPVAGGVGATPPAPAGATVSYDVKIVNNTTGQTLYDSSVGANNESKAYYIPPSATTTGGFVLSQQSSGNVLGSTIDLTGTSQDDQGLQVVAGMPLTVDLSKLTTTTVASAADGQTGAAPTWATSLTVYDSLGIGHQLNFNYTRALVGTGAPTGAASRWEWTASENGQVIGSSTQTGNEPLFFDANGALLDTKAQTVTVTPTNGASTFPVSVDFSTLSGRSGTSSVTAITQDGYAVGTLQTFSINEQGLITGIFSNGQSRSLGQIAMATFSNPAGLQKLGDNLYSQGNNSGLAQVGLPNTAGRGNINTGFLEMSNVDLSTEFTDLIVTQRGFQANTKIISTVDQMLQDVINLMR